MPAYLKSTNDSSIRIDIEELTKGRAQPGENALNLKMAFGSETVRLNYVALSYEDGLGQELHEPPAYITPHMTPGDGVAGIYLVGWIDEKEHKLHLEWIVETEWRDIVDDQLYLHASIMDPEKGLQVQSEPICLGKRRFLCWFTGSVLSYRLLQKTTPFQGGYMHWQQMQMQSLKSSWPLCIVLILSM